MKELIVFVFTLFIVTGCMMTPDRIENDASSRVINSTLICAKKIDVYQLSINGSKPPVEAFNHFVGIIRKYTTPNVEVHNVVNISVPQEYAHTFVSKFKKSRNYEDIPVHVLSNADRDKFINMVNESKSKDVAIVAIYVPELKKYNYRGSTYYGSKSMNVIVFNSTKIDAAPVISNTQAWKIVFTQMIGYRFGIPSSPTHNKAGNCTHRECAMYKKPDWRSVVSVLMQGMPTDYCELCQGELREAKKSCFE